MTPQSLSDGRQEAWLGLFKKAIKTKRRLKLLVWGDSGMGKTTLALRFPGVVVIDLEDGTAHYGDAFEFHVLKVTTADELMQAVDWLLTHPHPFCTLVIDPITIYWESLQSKWGRIFLQRNKGGKGHHGEFYELQPRDWVTLKAELKELVRKLIQLDMNVIITARQKAQYSDAGFMRAIGETFDGEKSLPYMFDVILRLFRDDAGRFMAENLKDRTNKLPGGKFEVSYDLIEKCLGTETLTREAAPLQLATPEQIENLRQFIAASGMKPEVLDQRLAAYGATRIEDLTADNAQIIIAKFTATAAAKSAVITQTKE